MNQEDIRSEEEHVASFRLALQRMHEDPAEAARIESIIEDAELADPQAALHDPHPHVVVNVSGGDRNTVKIFGSHSDAGSEPPREQAPAAPVSPVRTRKRFPIPEVQLTRTRAVANTASLSLMATIALFAMQGGGAMLSIVLSVLAVTTAGLSVLLPHGLRFTTRKAQLPLRGEDLRELDPH
nr:MULTISPECIES: hypothetical protein [Streptomyces]